MIIAALLFAAQASQVDYRFDQVKRNVALNDHPVAAGRHAQSGDKVATGWLSYALIASDHYRAKFEIFSSTNVQLAGGTPGVILTLERGKLKAIFDKITGSEPRVVQTPGALLAVRGTQYEIEVNGDGRTDLRVYEGTVEVRSHLQPRQSVFVHAGEMTTFGRQEAPMVHPMPDRDRERDHNPNGAQGPHGQGTPPPHDGRDHPEGTPHAKPPEHH